MANDWIDDLKRKDNDDRDDERRLQESKAREDAIIRGKTPDFWNALVEQVRSDCIRLQASYPTRNDRQAHISRERPHRDFILQGKSLPIRATSLELNLDGRFIRLVENITDEFGRGPQPITQHINISVDSADSLVFEIDGSEYRTTQDLSKRLFEYILGLNGA